MSSSRKRMDQQRNKGSDRCLRNILQLCDVSCNNHRNKELKNEIYKQFAETFQCTLQEIRRKLHNLGNLFYLFFCSPFFQYFLHHTK